jgi:uncharacterized DUF497 family protein
MRFEWDEAKSKSNLAKHNVRFETAALVFDDPHQVIKPDRMVDGEMRWHTIGFVEGQALLLVVHTYRDVDEEEVIRIISARRADAKDRRHYGDGDL